MKKVEIFEEEKLQIENMEDFENLAEYQWIDIYSNDLYYPEETKCRFVGSVNKGDIERIKITANGHLLFVNGVLFRSDTIAVLG